MESQKVLLRKGEDGRYHEVGLVQAQQGKSLIVLLPDGSTMEHERGRDEVTPVAGSYTHLVRISPDSVKKALEEQPAVVFKQILHDAGKGMRALDLKQRISDVDDSLVDRSWTTAKAAFDSDPEIERSSARQPVYKLRANEVDGFSSLFPTTAADVPPTPDDEEPHEASLTDASDTPEQDVEPAAVLPETGTATATHQQEEPAPSDEPETAPLAVAPPTSKSDDRPLLLIRLPDLAAGLPLKTLADASAHPLALGEHVRRLSSQAQADLVDGLPGPERRLLALACGQGKRGLLAAEAGALEVPDYTAALDAAISEVARRPAAAKELKDGLTELVARAARAGDLPASLLIRLAGVFSSQPAEPEGLRATLDLISTRLRRSEDEDPRGWDLAALARAARSAPYARTGGRTGLVAALYRRAPEEAVKPRWWEGLRLTELTEAGHGALAIVLEDERVSARVAPLVQEYVDNASSRSAIATLWTLPKPLARHVTADRLSRALADVGSRDPISAEWTRGLSNADTITELQNKVSGLSADLDAQRKRVSQLAAQVERLQSDLARAADQLAAARSSDTAVRGAHERQVKLDLVRTLALVAAQVMQSEAARGDQALVRQVQHLCRREGLEPLVEPGERVPFDPARHDPLGAALASETLAEVVRGGYTWADGDNHVVLLKAQVVAVQGE